MPCPVCRHLQQNGKLFFASFILFLSYRRKGLWCEHHCRPKELSVMCSGSKAKQSGNRTQNQMVVPTKFNAVLYRYFLTVRVRNVWNLLPRPSWMHTQLIISKWGLTRFLRTSLWGTPVLLACSNLSIMTNYRYWQSPWLTSCSLIARCTKLPLQCQRTFVPTVTRIVLADSWFARHQGPVIQFIWVGSPKLLPLSNEPISLTREDESSPKRQM